MQCQAVERYLAVISVPGGVWETEICMLGYTRFSLSVSPNNQCCFVLLKYCAIKHIRGSVFLYLHRDSWLSDSFVGYVYKAYINVDTGIKNKKTESI